ncbi:hypothetical protein [Actinomadura parmotrematis]|uniref:Uncharacterized protein n=1 Tax=Actinomadura parmotrematis TaxID=2864039 RepID=A0ABS7G167_9ACTN|nr:hypothetical protein [Actinomadura parmotrematis]MBW8486454.1 hypothetical protein [Actinomadura parmotrematis]
MRPHDAQDPPDDVRLLHGSPARSHGFRQGSSLPLTASLALGLFFVLGSVDLPGAWRKTGLALGLATFVVLGMAVQHRAGLRRRATGPEVALHLAATFLLLVLYLLCSAATVLAHTGFGLPSPHSVAAAATAVLALAFALPARRLLKRFLKLDDPS